MPQTPSLKAVASHLKADKISPRTANIPDLIKRIADGRYSTAKPPRDTAVVLTAVRYAPFPYQPGKRKRNPYLYYKRKNMSYIGSLNQIIACKLIQRVKLTMRLYENGHCLMDATLDVDKKAGYTQYYLRNNLMNSYDLRQTPIHEIEEAWRQHKFMTKIADEVKYNYEAYSVFASMKNANNE